MHTRSSVATLSSEWMGMHDDLTTETEPPRPAPFLWDWFGPGELLPLQDQLELVALLRLRSTSKAVRDELDAVAPPAVALMHWLITNLRTEKDSSCSFPTLYRPRWLRASLHELFGARKLLRTVTALDVGINMLRTVRAWKFGIGISDALNDTISRRTITAVCNYHGTLTSVGLVALLQEVVDAGGLVDWNITDDAHMDWNFMRTVHEEPRTLFVFAAESLDLNVVKFLAARPTVNEHWVSSRLENAYTVAYRRARSSKEYWENEECDYPNHKVFTDTRRGETFDEYMERHRAKHQEVLSYLCDDLGISTAPDRPTPLLSSDDESEEDDESEGEEEEEGGEEGDP